MRLRLSSVHLLKGRREQRMPSCPTGDGACGRPPQLRWDNKGGSAMAREIRFAGGLQAHRHDPQGTTNHRRHWKRPPPWPAKGRHDPACCREQCRWWRPMVGPFGLGRHLLRQQGQCSPSGGKGLNPSSGEADGKITNLCSCTMHLKAAALFLTAALAALSVAATA